jgi:hypothetical protein
MIRFLAASALTVALGAPALAQGTAGMGAMQYYVGTWSCQAGPVGQPSSNATTTFTLDSGVLRQWVLVPAQGKMTNPYVLSIVTTYDAKNGRYVEATLDNQAQWSISFAKPWTGNTEEWTDNATSTGKLGRGETIRTDNNTFSFSGYDTMTSTTASFKGTCTRSS